jgi:hypothetical protein
MVTQLTLLVAVHVQPLGVVTLIVPDVPLFSDETEVG